MPVTAEGWVVVKGMNTVPDYKTFVKRVVTDVIDSNVSDDSQFDNWAHYAWEVPDWDTLLSTLGASQWVCGEGVHRNLMCTTPPPGWNPYKTPKYAWLLKPMLSIVSLVVFAALCTCLYVRCGPDDTQDWYHKQKE